MFPELITMLSDEIRKYVEILKDDFPAIEEIWLLGSRANGTARSDSDWDFLVFSSEPPKLKEKLQRMTKYHRDDVDLFVVDEDRNFVTAFGKTKGGSLDGWKWNQNSANSASYKGTKADGAEGVVCLDLEAILI